MLQHTDERLESPSSAFVLRTVGDLSGDNRWTQGSFRPVVSGLDPGIVEEPQEIPSVVLSTDAIQQSLVIVIAQNAIPKMMSQLPIELPNLLLIIGQ
jgi:hypothetical protein